MKPEGGAIASSSRGREAAAGSRRLVRHSFGNEGRREEGLVKVDPFAVIFPSLSAFIVVHPRLRFPLNTRI